MSNPHLLTGVAGVTLLNFVQSGNIDINEIVRLVSTIVISVVTIIFHIKQAKKNN